MGNGLPRRRALRLKDHDYSEPGAYFVTICVHQKRPLYGRIDGEPPELQLSSAGRMVLDHWCALPLRFSRLEIDEVVVMPNHLHGMLLLLERGESLGRIVQAFKSETTRAYIAGVLAHGWPRFAARLWQRGYYDHIIRGDTVLDRIRE